MQTLSAALLLLAASCRAVPISQGHVVVMQARPQQEECAVELANASYQFVEPEFEPQPEPQLELDSNTGRGSR